MSVETTLARADAVLAGERWHPRRQHCTPCIAAQRARKPDRMCADGGPLYRAHRDADAEHGQLRLLLAYAGGYEEETRAHNRFAAAHVTGEWFRPALPLLLEIGRLRRVRAGQVSRLPEQVPATEIRALIKAVREQPLTATLTATKRADRNGQERPGAPKVAGQRGVSR